MKQTQHRPLVVLESFSEPRPTTNPYIVMLLRALESTDGLTARTFSWSRALFGRYDVFHVHWPELLVTNGPFLKQTARQLLFALMMLRLSVLRVPVVRTQHNLRPHQDLAPRPAALMRMLDRRTTTVVWINSLPAPDADRSVHRILHGHYRDWYASIAEPDAEPGRLGFFGLIRPYKGVEELLRAFAGTGPALRLAVSGKPDDEALLRSLTDAATGDARIDLSLRYVTDEELVQHVGRCSLVVLPYRQGLNSGGALAALSLSRPVLMPATDANRALADEVGADWVRLYEGELTAAVLETEAARARDLTGHPDLTARRWQTAGPDHLAAFRDAVARRRGTRRPRSTAGVP
jgi:beta-1,4-mannosyltransferase